MSVMLFLLLLCLFNHPKGISLAWYHMSCCGQGIRIAMCATPAHSNVCFLDTVCHKEALQMEFPFDLDRSPTHAISNDASGGQACPKPLEYHSLCLGSTQITSCVWLEFTWKFNKYNRHTFQHKTSQRSLLKATPTTDSDVRFPVGSFAPRAFLIYSNSQLALFLQLPFKLNANQSARCKE